MVAQIGRPSSENPKQNDIRIRLTDADVEQLDYCAMHLGLPKAEVLRQGLYQMYRDAEKKANLSALSDDDVLEHLQSDADEAWQEARDKVYSSAYEAAYEREYLIEYAKQLRAGEPPREAREIANEAAKDIAEEDAKSAVEDWNS